jgi:membrane-associated phospholipid phosphatase
MLIAKSRLTLDTLFVDSKNAGRVCARIAAGPFHTDARGWLTTAALAGGLTASTLFDSQIHNDIRDIHHRWASPVDDIGHAYPQIYVSYGTAGALYAFGSLTEKPEIRRIGAEVVEAVTIAGVGTQTVKYLLGRARPCSGLSNGHFSGPSLDNGSHSFPSGDVTIAFAQSSVFASEIKFWPVTIALYGLASTTAFQRLHRDQHWFSDIFGGALWGTAVGLGVVYANQKLYSNRVSLELLPGSVAVRW